MATYVTSGAQEYVYNIETTRTSTGTTSIISTVPAGTWYELLEWQAYCHDGTGTIYLDVLTPATLIGGDVVTSNQSAGYGSNPWKDRYNLLDFSGGIDFDGGDYDREADFTATPPTGKGSSYVMDAAAPITSVTIKLNGTYGFNTMADQAQCHWKKELSTAGVTVKAGQTAEINATMYDFVGAGEFVQVVTWWKKIVGTEG